MLNQPPETSPGLALASPQQTHRNADEKSEQIALIPSAPAGSCLLKVGSHQLEPDVLHKQNHQPYRRGNNR